ncbi:MAG: potassium transporter TrkG [Phycisphaerae bacterium]|nr:potassium transporter TrkG [Phycisphaerae bacterium]MDD5380042.1 potassium transporter TrkG [Phycisphaerae bacterium]
MQMHYKNNRLEKVLIGVNSFAAAAVAATFVWLFGFDKPIFPVRILYVVQATLLFVFVIEKIVRLFNSVSKREFWRANWYEVPLLLALAAAVLGSGRWFGEIEPFMVRRWSVGIYLVLQVVIKVCRTGVRLAASGRSPAQTLIASFLILIISGAGLLMLPKASTAENVSAVDALFTATSATCITGLVVKDIGKDFSLMGKVVILSLIQLGGLGILMFGVIFGLLLGQALSLRESAAMQDLLSASTVGRISNMIIFIFIAAIVIEAAGAVGLFWMWDNIPGKVTSIQQQWFFSIFHSISAFCNSGLSLFSDSFVSYNKCWGVYVIICPLIILGGLGFIVLYDLIHIAADRIKRFLGKLFYRRYYLPKESPKRMMLQTKIVLTATLFLIVFGMLSLLLFEHYAGQGGTTANIGVRGAFFQSITARTAGFNTVDIKALAPASKCILILLMFVGGSPGGTAGGIKTVTLCVIMMAAVAVLRRRQEIEMFNRSIRTVTVYRAITVTLFFVAVLFTTVLALSITERANNFTMLDIMFETGSALGTVGLSTGITPSLTTAGKLIIIVVMFFGRLGPLTLLAAIAFNIKPVRYNYPDEAIIVG